MSVFVGFAFEESCLYPLCVFLGFVLFIVCVVGSMFVIVAWCCFCLFDWC